MFDTVTTGKKIMEQRKLKNLTQMALADEMGVSYQAVSNWERGNSMPDISKLPELADLFGCSIDYLLGTSKETEFVKKVIKNELIDTDDEDAVKIIADTAPIMTPKKTEEMIEAVVKKKSSMNIKELIMIAPFVGDDYLEGFLNQIDVIEDIGDVIALAPFLGEAQLENVTEKITSLGGLGKVVGLAPFISESSLDQLVRKVVDNEGAEQDYKNSIQKLAPFLSDDTLNYVVEHIDLKMDMKVIITLAPFLSDETLSKMALKATEEGEISELHGLYPFLEKKVLQTIADKILKERGYEGLKGIAPFL